MATLGPQVLSFPFLRLPRELRDEIYGWVYTDFPGQRLREARPKIQLLQTSPMINREALSILYGTNYFDMNIGSEIDLGDTVSAIPQASSDDRGLPLLRHLNIQIDLPEMREGTDQYLYGSPETKKQTDKIMQNLRSLCMALLKRHSNLRTLCITINRPADLRLRHIGNKERGVDLLLSFKELRAGKVEIKQALGCEKDESNLQYLEDIKDTMEGRRESLEHSRLTAMYHEIENFARSLRIYSYTKLRGSGQSFKRLRGQWESVGANCSPVVLGDPNALARINFRMWLDKVESIYSSWLTPGSTTREDTWANVVRAREWLYMRPELRALMPHRSLPELEEGHDWSLLKYRTPMQSDLEGPFGQGIVFRTIVTLEIVVLLWIIVLLLVWHPCWLDGKTCP